MFEERLRVPMVYIVYTRAQVCVIDYQLCQGRTVRRGVTTDPAGTAVFGRVVAWLTSDPPEEA